MRATDPMLVGIKTMELNRTHGGTLMVLPPPSKTLIANDLLRVAIDSGFIHRDNYTITIRALNAWATYRLGTLERGVWFATLVEWSAI